MRVLLIAESANPEWVSVPLVGWSQARAIAELVDAHLVTQVRNRDAILRAGYREGVEFTAIDSEAIASRVAALAGFVRGGDGKGWTTVTALDSLSYWYFERKVWQRFGDRLLAGEYDLVHRITPLSPTTPSLIARKLARAGIPFVLGPLNGGLPWPEAFGDARRREREWLSYVRSLHRLLPGYRATRDGAKAILVGSRATWGQMPSKYQDKCVYMPENGIDPARFPDAAEPFRDYPVRVAFLGRLVPYKGADMLLEAAAGFIRAGKIAVEILGDGPERPLLERLVRELRIEAGVTFAGWVDQLALPGRLRRSQVFGFPSIREFGGAVVLEAMASGLVPLVVDYGGPGESITVETGMRVPLGTRERIVDGLQVRLAELVADPQQIARYGARARTRAMTQFAWSTKAVCIREIYRWVLGRRGKPDFGCPFAPLAPGEDRSRDITP